MHTELPQPTTVWLR